MELVTVRDGDRIIYVEKERIKEIILRPEIQQVPGAPGHVSGIIIYGDMALAVFRLGNDGAAKCAIVMHTPDAGRLWGITGEPDGEEAQDEQNLTEIMPGIWEKCCDKTEQQGIRGDCGVHTAELRNQPGEEAGTD